MPRFIRQSTIQVRRYPDDGFALHKVPLGKGHASGYYRKDGSLADAEYFGLPAHPEQGKPLKIGGPLWRKLEAAGKPFILPEHGR